MKELKTIIAVLVFALTLVSCNNGDKNSSSDSGAVVGSSQSSCTRGAVVPDSTRVSCTRGAVDSTPGDNQASRDPNGGFSGGSFGDNDAAREPDGGYNGNFGDNDAARLPNGGFGGGQTKRL
ncbi:MAG: hypothetical protein IKW83_07415 [Muribaculaceae bacterium]|nr:hypothetical protein [Muribaculaceae bacterium]